MVTLYLPIMLLSVIVFGRDSSLQLLIMNQNDSAMVSLIRKILGGILSCRRKIIQQLLIWIMII